MSPDKRRQHAELASPDAAGAEILQTKTLSSPTLTICVDLACLTVQLNGLQSPLVMAHGAH